MTGLTAVGCIYDSDRMKCIVTRHGFEPIKGIPNQLYKNNSISSNNKFEIDIGIIYPKATAEMVLRGEEKM